MSSLLRPLEQLALWLQSDVDPYDKALALEKAIVASLNPGGEELFLAVIEMLHARQYWQQPRTSVLQQGEPFATGGVNDHRVRAAPPVGCSWNRSGQATYATRLTPLEEYPGGDNLRCPSCRMLLEPIGPAVQRCVTCGNVWLMVAAHE